MSASSTQAPVVVVGVDGSTPALAAAREAAHLARRRGWPLLLAAAGSNDTQDGAALADAGDAVVRACPEVAPETMVRPGSPVEVLGEAAGRDGVVVVGRRGRGALRSTLLGSTSLALASKAPCPVVVVPGDTARAGGTVVVGVESRTPSEVVGFAFDEAATRGTALTAVHAWEGHTDLREEITAVPADVRQRRIREEEDVLLAALEPWLEKHPDVPVRRHVADAPTTKLLLRQAARAALVVVGRGALDRPLGPLGSTVAALLREATCPVAVVPPR